MRRIDNYFFGMLNKWQIGSSAVNAFLVLLLTLGMISCRGQQNTGPSISFITEEDIRVGAQQTGRYFPLLRDRRIGVVANQTSLIGRVHLVDSLISAGFSLQKIFGPEHGFRGDQEAGKEIVNGIDPVTGVPVVSLYGAHKKPTQQDLLGIDIMLFDIQDVGARFYTYISTMSYVMEACAENGIPLIILDRPNPNGFYVDGPVLDTAYRSFVGLHPVPVVHGMTTGEYALMVNGEGWLQDGSACDLTIVPVEGYRHTMIYKLPVPPSPNLPDWQSVYLYPSLALFEGTIISVGRGTEYPFRVIGHPDFAIGSFVFTPKSIPGVSDHPLYEGKACYGQNLTGFAENIRQNEHHFTLQFLIRTYEFFKASGNYFNPYFDKLAGSALLKEYVIQGEKEEVVREKWDRALDAFKYTRSRYLLYED